MFTRLCIVLLLALGVGCGKSSPSPPASASPPVPAADASAASSAEVSPAAAAPAPEAMDEAQLAAAIAELTQAVRKYAVEQRRAPTTFEELVAQGYLAQAPVAPAGKKFAISKNLQVYLTDR